MRTKLIVLAVSAAALALALAAYVPGPIHTYW